MSSPAHAAPVHHQGRRPSAYVLEQDEGDVPLLSTRTSTLTALIRNRSAAHLPSAGGHPGHPTPSRRLSLEPGGHDEEEAGDSYSIGSSGLDADLECGRRGHPGPGAEERRLSAILNAPRMRSMRLIGNNNPRYRWERYYRSEEELKGMRKPMYETLTCYFYSENATSSWGRAISVPIPLCCGQMS